MAVDLLLLQPLIDNQPPWEPQNPKVINNLEAYSSTQAHSPTSVEILTTKEGVHDHIVHSATCVSAVEEPIQSSSVPTLRDSLFTHLDIRGPRTPLWPLILECKLRNHPEKTFVEQLLLDIRQGCNIGYTGPQFAFTTRNLQSASSQPSILDDTLATECSLNRILGPFDFPPLPNFRSSGLGLVPKHDGGWRTIYHLSSPPGRSINDFIDPQTYTLSYCSVDDAFAIVNLLGPGTLLSKIDLKNAFRLIPVHQADWNLLGIFWQGKDYIDTCLPFGLRSAPCIFNRLATAIHWILQNNYNVQFILHYLDDFLTAGPPNSPVCKQNLQAMLSLCQRINAPIKPEKVVPFYSNQSFIAKKNVPNVNYSPSLASSCLPAKWFLLDAFFYVASLIWVWLSNTFTTTFGYPKTLNLTSYGGRIFLPTWSGSSLILDTLASGILVTSPVSQANFVERALCHCQCCEYLGPSMGQTEDPISLWLPSGSGDLAQGHNTRFGDHRFQLHHFRALAPGAQPSPDPIRAWPTPSFLHHSDSSSTLE